MSIKPSLLMLALLPSRLKILILRMRGHQIGKNVRIGFCYLDIRMLCLEDNVSINNFNYFKNLRCLEMKERARIGGWGNWFTASNNNNDGDEGFGCLTIGLGSNITSRHYFDIQGRLTIGSQTLVAGFGSVFYTHTVTPDFDNVNKPIHLGDNCYIGSHCLFLPGATVGSSTFVAAGSVVVKNHEVDTRVLLAGNPAVVKKRYDSEASFFQNDHTGFVPKNLRR